MMTQMTNTNGAMTWVWGQRWLVFLWLLIAVVGLIAMLTGAR